MGSETPTAAADGSGWRRESGVMRVYLLPRRQGFHLVSAELEALLREEHQEPAAAADEQSRLRRLARAARAGYRRLTRARAARERLLSELAHPATIEVSYPAALGEAAARGSFRGLLESWVRKHRRWLLANGAMLPLGVLLTLLPGPNVALAYLAVRSAAHYRSKRGGETALASPEVVFRAEPGLDPLLELARRRFVLNRRRREGEICARLGIPAPGGRQDRARR